MGAAKPSSRGAGKRRPWKKRLLLLVVVLIAIYSAVIATLIVRQSGRDEARSADAIVVFGAAEYAGKPSPVLRARLDHALDLYRRGLAPDVITTGGAGADVRYTEGGVGLGYLEHHGVPAAHVFAETEARNTDRSAENVARIMRSHSMSTCIAVSDGYHLFRIKRMMAQQGITAYGSPRTEGKPPGRMRGAELVAREVISYTFWKLHIT